MGARWGSLPPKAKVAAERKPRRKATPQSWRCGGPNGCGDVFTTEAALYRHLDAQGGGRAECIFELRTP